MGDHYVLFGGIKQNSKDFVVQPTDETYVLRINNAQCNWAVQSYEDDAPKPKPRSQHVALQMNQHKLFIFGGHYKSSVRLNDVWFLDSRKGVWSCPEYQDPSLEPENQACPAGGPDPRANSAATLLDDKIYIFGGQGGLQYKRDSFNDLYAFDINEHTWEKIEYNGNPPEPRGGHSMFWLERKLYIYGGWNNELQYEQIFQFDLDTREWFEPDISGNEIVPRWNHSAIMVEAIPSWKYFIFGGEFGQFMEGGPREFGEYQNIARFLDIETMSWNTILTEDHESENHVIPKERELTSMSYDHRNSRLIVFGGWANKWMNDIYALNVSSIVGPPYAISEIIPNLGQLSGNTEVILRGIGFNDTSNINIRFSCGKQFVEVGGEYISDTEIRAKTKSFEEIGPKEAEVRLQIQGRDFTTTAVKFSFFKNTIPEKSLAYGPGLLDGAAIGSQVSFVIQARNEHDENRQSGNDKWNVTIKTKGEKTVEIKNEVVDNDNGTYTVTYQVDEPILTVVDVQLFNDGLEIPLRGTPFKVTFEESTAKNQNKLTGPLMDKYIKRQLEFIKTFIEEKTDGVQCTEDKDVEHDVKNLIAVKDNVEEVQNRHEETVLDLDKLDESLKLFHSQGLVKDAQLKQMKKLFDGYAQLKKRAKETKKEIEPFVENESDKNKNIIKRHEDSLK